MLVLLRVRDEFALHCADRREVDADAELEEQKAEEANLTARDQAVKLPISGNSTGAAVNITGNPKGHDAL